MKIDFKKSISFNLGSILLCLLLSNSVFCQLTGEVGIEEEKENAIFIEGLGHGFIYSLNYEGQLFGNRRTQTSGQIGVSYYGKKSGVIPLWVPISLNQSLRIYGNNFIEVGVGKMFQNDGVELADGTFRNNYQLKTMIFRFGYKRFFNNKWLFKIAYTPIFRNEENEYIHWGGVAFGYRF